jgi:hypothetical protein
MSNKASHLPSSYPQIQYVLHLNIANNIHTILTPTQTDDITTAMVLLTLDPSPADITTHINPLSARLSALESTLRDHNRWHAPPVPPKSPEYSIIDVNDLSSAIKLLEDILAHSLSSSSSSSNNHQCSSPQPLFSKYKWTWDPAWKEFYTQTSDDDDQSFIYLSRWRLNEARQVWEHVSMNGRNLLPDGAAEMLGSWDDWSWDAVWKEWFLDESTDDGEKCCVYATRWEVREGGEWVYVGRIGSAGA